MLIIVEGPDCAGKSTLVERLAGKLTRRDDAAVRVLHKRKPTASTFLDEYLTPLLTYRPGGDHVVCDRWHLGEVVYPVVFRRPSLLDASSWRYLEAYLRARGALVVHLSAPLHQLKRRLASRGDDLVDVDMLASVRLGFYEAQQRSACVGLLVESNTAEVVDRVIAAADELDRRTRPLAPFATYVGAPQPDLLLVGDVRSRIQGGDLRPAFAPNPATSGRYLWEALGALYKPPYLPQFGLANANDVDDVNRLYGALGRPLDVVALGVHAHDTLERVNLPHRRAPHPQYVRRFHHRQVARYRDHLLGRSEPVWNSTSPI